MERREFLKFALGFVAAAGAVATTAAAQAAPALPRPGSGDAEAQPTVDAAQRDAIEADGTEFGARHRWRGRWRRRRWRRRYWRPRYYRRRWWRRRRRWRRRPRVIYYW